MLNQNVVVALAEAREHIVARRVEDDRLHRVVELLALVRVGERHLRAHRAVSAVHHNVHRHLVIQVHVLVDARSAGVAPHNLALALLERVVDARIVRVALVVALVHGAHAPLVHANRNLRPLHVHVRRVGTPHGRQEHGVVAVVGTVVVAVRAVDVVVVQAAVATTLGVAHEHNVVDQEAVAGAGMHRAVLLVHPLEVVLTGRDGHAVGLPTAVLAVLEHLLAVKEEAAHIPVVAVRRALATGPQVEAELAVLWNVHRHLER